MADAYERTRTLLNVRSAELTNLAELLLEKETINQVRPRGRQERRELHARSRPLP